MGKKKQRNNNLRNLLMELKDGINDSIDTFRCEIDAIIEDTEEELEAILEEDK